MTTGQLIALLRTYPTTFEVTCFFPNDPLGDICADPVAVTSDTKTKTVCIEIIPVH